MQPETAYLRSVAINMSRMTLAGVFVASAGVMFVLDGGRFMTALFFLTSVAFLSQAKAELSDGWNRRIWRKLDGEPDRGWHDEVKRRVVDQRREEAR